MRYNIFHVEEPIVVPMDILTQGGCNVITMCSANGADTVVWSPTRTGTPFVNTSSSAAWVSELLVV